MTSIRKAALRWARAQYLLRRPWLCGGENATDACIEAERAMLEALTGEVGRDPFELMALVAKESGLKIDPRDDPDREKSTRKRRRRRRILDAGG